MDGRTDLYVLARGHITVAIHRNYIREPIVRPLAGAIVDAFMLMQYNASAFPARVSLTFLDDEWISVMNWLTSSAYLNPIEHTWDMHSRRIGQQPHHPGKV